MGFTKYLSHPLTCGLNIDAQETTYLRKRIIREKAFLHRLYKDWYALLTTAVPDGTGQALELGSGGGFLREYIPDLITSDILAIPGVDQVVDAHALPFGTGELRAILMTNVLHHLQEPRRFFQEAARCVHEGGVVAMLEPWHTPWSRFIYQHFHHEPFDPTVAEWEIPPAGPLSGGNDAMPWVLFSRDRQRFLKEFPQWRIGTIQPLMPFRYLLSGGVGFRRLMPGWSYPSWRWLEQRLDRWRDWLAMFAHIVLVRTNASLPPQR